MKQRELTGTSLAAMPKLGPNLRREMMPDSTPANGDYPSSTSREAPESSLQTSDVPVRRQQVEQLLRQGYSNKAIADKLRIGVPLVKYELRAIYAAAGVTTSREYFSTTNFR